MLDELRDVLNHLSFFMYNIIADVGELHWKKKIGFVSRYFSGLSFFELEITIFNFLQIIAIDS